MAAHTADRTQNWQAFIRANTKLLAPPLVPEIRLHLAEESLPIWQKTEDELGEMNVPPPYWAFAWAGGQALARYVLDNPDKVAGRTVLDLGAGSGLVAIAAAKAGAATAIANDPDRIAEIAAALNAEANAASITTLTDDLLDTDPSSYGTLLIGDLFYEKPLAERVLAFARRAMASGATVLIGDPKRSYLPTGILEPIARYEVPVTRELEDSEINSTAVWQLKTG